MGVKPLVYFQDDDKFVFASEMKALLAFGIKKEIDKVSLAQYFEFNYIPSPFSIFKNVRKLLPGSYFIINCEGDILEGKYYSIPKPDLDLSSDSYDQAKQKIEQILDNSVRLRMISDVPLGAFLSGGIDSSVITALASRHTNKLDTFSIGYKDEPYFDETRYANLVAKKYKTNHTVFSLTNSDLFGNLHQVLDYLDEPFADSSALAVHILSMQTRKKVTVALSGDGADELFSGYNKHLAHHKAFQNNLTNLIIKNSQAFLKKLPQSRNSKFGNLFRQLNRFSEGLNTTDRDRYWRWCVVNEENYVKELLIDARFNTEYYARKLKMKTAIKKGISMKFYIPIYILYYKETCYQKLI
jgi:asparagine synthase (glutamine-hydrolysing)